MWPLILLLVWLLIPVHKAKLPFWQTWPLSPVHALALRPDLSTAQPYVSPLHQDNLADLPPTLLVTNGFDPLRDVGHAYAQKLAKAGNEITYVHHPELTHGFPQFAR